MTAYSCPDHPDNWCLREAIEELQQAFPGAELIIDDDESDAA